MKPKIVSLGEILIDFTPVATNGKNPRFDQNPGGAPMNVLAAASKLGIHTDFIGCVGEDQFGHFLLDFLEKQGIGNSHVILSDTHHTTLAFVHLKENGERDFSFYRKHGADLMLREEDIKESFFKEAKVFHFGSLSLTADPSRSATRKAIAMAKERQCIISYDPNLRPPLWDSLEKAKVHILSVMEEVDILKLSEEELIFLTGISDIVEASDRLYQEYNLPLMIVTMGEKGCALRRRKEFGQVEGVSVKAVDTTGAGDSHLGAMLAQFLTKKHYAVASFEELLTYAKFANAYAGYVTTKFGSAEIMPDKERLIQWAESSLSFLGD